MQTPRTPLAHSTCPQHTLTIPSLRHNSAPQKNPYPRLTIATISTTPKKSAKIYLGKIGKISLKSRIFTPKYTSL